jgi:hypothetical protein
VRGVAASGRIVSVWSWRGAVAAASVDAAGIVVEMRDGTRHVHARAPHGWHVDLVAGSARSSIDLGGVRERPAPSEEEPGLAAEPMVVPPADAAPLRLELGEDHYRRSEQDWRDSGCPAASVELGQGEGALVVDLRVRKLPRCFAPARDANPLDNERADVNSDGAQLHLLPSSGGDPWSWLLVPEEGGERVRVTSTGAAGAPPLEAAWHATAEGWALRCRLPLAAVAPEGRFALDVIVNETAPGRERRRGQLVLSGARGEFVYLRGDRQPADRLLPFVVAHG